MSDLTPGKIIIILTDAAKYDDVKKAVEAMGLTVADHHKKMMLVHVPAGQENDCIAKCKQVPGVKNVAPEVQYRLAKPGTSPFKEGPQQ